MFSKLGRWEYATIFHIDKLAPNPVFSFRKIDLGFLNYYFFSTFFRYQTIANGTLRIHSVQEGDEGSYQCVVRNDGDSAQATGSLLLGGKDIVIRL